MKILSMPAGGAKADLIFPPETDWQGYADNASDTAEVSSTLLRAVINGQSRGVTFFKPFTAYASNKTITITASSVNSRRLYVYINGVEASVTVLANNINTINTITVPLPAGENNVQFRLVNASWPTGGNTIIRTVSVS